MLTQSQRDALSIAHTEISAIIKDLTERMKAKGYERATVSVDCGPNSPFIWLRAGGAKVFRSEYSGKMMEYSCNPASVLSDAVERAYAAVDALDDLTALNDWFDPNAEINRTIPASWQGDQLHEQLLGDEDILAGAAS